MSGASRVSGRRNRNKGRKTEDGRLQAPCPRQASGLHPFALFRRPAGLTDNTRMRVFAFFPADGYTNLGLMDRQLAPGGQGASGNRGTAKAMQTLKSRNRPRALGPRPLLP